MDINEVVCGDPTCAPIDTVFTLIWEAGGKGKVSNSSSRVYPLIC